MSDTRTANGGVLVRLAVTGPFSLPFLLGSVLRRPNEIVDLVTGGEYRRLIAHRGRPVLVSASSPPDDPQAVILRVEAPDGVPGTGAVAAARELFARVASLDADPAPFYERVSDDTVLGPLTRAHWGLRPLGSADIFEMLIVAILGQQISMIAAGAIKRRMVQALGMQATIGGRTYYAFPTAEALAAADHQQLLALAFSNRKSEYVRDLASQVAGGQLDLEGLRGLPHQTIVERLVAVRGIGHWTAEYVLLRGYGYPDALPAGDAGLRRQIARLYHLETPPSEREIILMGEAWRPYRSWATLYLWNADLAV